MRREGEGGGWEEGKRKGRGGGDCLHHTFASRSNVWVNFLRLKSYYGPEGASVSCLGLFVGPPRRLEPGSEESELRRRWDNGRRTKTGCSEGRRTMGGKKIRLQRGEEYDRRRTKRSCSEERKRTMEEDKRRLQ